MTIGTGIFLSTILIIAAYLARYITQKGKWRPVTWRAAQAVGVVVALAGVWYLWHYLSSLPPAPSVTMELAGLKLGMSPAEVKLTAGSPTNEGEPTREGSEIRFAYTYDDRSVVFYGPNKYSAKAELICSARFTDKLLGFSRMDTKTAVVDRLGTPNTTSIRSDAMSEIISYTKWHASFEVSQGIVYEICIHTFPAMAFTDHLLSPKAQEEADKAKAAADAKASTDLAAATLAIQTAGASQNSLTPTIRSRQSGSKVALTDDGSDPCAPGLSRSARLKRLAKFGNVREVSDGSFEAPGHSLSFIPYVGGLLSCT